MKTKLDRTLDVDVQYAVDAPGIPDETDIRRWLTAVMSGRRNEAEMTVRITDKVEMTQLNKSYRQQNKPTNVLSFPMEAPPGVDIPLLGDIVICADVVAEEAVEQDKSLEAHWAHMIVHGGLHLLGYDHIHDSDAERMERLEIEILETLGFPDPYQDELVIE